MCFLSKAFILVITYIDIVDYYKGEIMYECPNCGGNLKFDIPSGQLACAFCAAHVDPYSVQKDVDATEKEYFETTVFTCPQCSGELFSTDSDATSFCSFCGASTILSSRISRERRPKYIVPFKKTKEDCKRAYSQKMRRALFVPKELKDPKYIDGFRGIYMPYWSYQLAQKGSVTLAGESTKQKGDYLITSHYDLKGDLNSYYLGYSFDASSSFYDSISESLAPYDAKQLVKFTPAFLSGFYADTADVDSDVYLDDAIELADESTYQKIAKEKEFQKYIRPYNKENAPSIKRGLRTQLLDADNTMYPVWFLSYRKGDRIAYATVNGQTGKVVADMPIDPMKYVIGSLLLAVPIFVLLNLIFTLKPSTVLVLGAFLAVVTSIIAYMELKSIRKKEMNEGDKALMQKEKQRQRIWSREQAREQAMQNEAWDYSQQEIIEEPKKEKKKMSGSAIYTMAIIGFAVLFQIVANGISVVLVLVSIIGIIAGIIIWGAKVYKESKKGDPKEREKMPNFLLTAVIVLVALFIMMVNPVSDLYYYGGAIIAFMAVLYSFVDIIRKYNKLATRRLPQFDKQGGDDRA